MTRVSEGRKHGIGSKMYVRNQNKVVDVKGKLFLYSLQTFDTKCMGFPLQAILQFSLDSSWVSYKSVQF